MTFSKNLPTDLLAYLGLSVPATIFHNLEPAELITNSLQNHEGVLTNTGALAVDTGAFTGRAPEDKFFVKDDYTAESINWNDINQPISSEVFKNLKLKMLQFCENKKLYVADVAACADPIYRLNVRVIASTAFHCLFAQNMFIRLNEEEKEIFQPEYTVLCLPEFEANPEVDGTPRKNFAIINLSEKTVIIGGTGYTGEIKKGIFSVLNFLLPKEKDVLSMHCSANVGKQGDTAVFFGLSGTGKTTLSADPDRYLVGDDEHGWSERGIFNFEGGCYAKTINLSKENEPDIWNAIKFGAILENTRFFEGTNEVNYADSSVTPNTRVSYPLHHIPNALEPSIAKHPKHIFFLTCDSFGVLPPISKLTSGQAMFHFISGYTAKVAGTEVGVKEPKSVFSACFGAPFLPLHPAQYAGMLGEKMRKHHVQVWLINTGWTGGPYGEGSRMKIPYTRSMIAAALDGRLGDVAFHAHPVFGVLVPVEVPGVPAEVLDPKNTWANKHAYDLAANKLADMFLTNFEKYRDMASEEIMAGAPQVLENSNS
jgi:phosphoenolpyruvate carboxykinase (ATP)